MASRNERRRKARQQAIQVGEASHGDRMMAVVVKAASSRQAPIQKPDQWDPEKTIRPPLPPDQLWSIYEQHPYHGAAINAKVADSVGRGWRLVAEDDTEDGADDELDTVTRQLTDTLKAVCTKLTFAHLCRQVVTEMDAIGWGAWEIIRERAGDVGSEIVGILPVPAQNLRATKISDDVYCLARGEARVYFKRFGVAEHVDVKTGTLDASVADDDRGNELVVFSHYSPRSSYYGIPPWISAMPPIAELTAIREYNVSYFESGGQADRLIHATAKDAGVAEELADQIVKQLDSSKGVAHISLITHGDAETAVVATPLQMKTATGTKEVDFRGGRSDLVAELLAAHGVPPYRVGIAETGSLGGDTAAEMDDDYRVGVVEPLKELVEAELERTIFGEFGFQLPGWVFEFEAMTQDDEQADHARAMEAKEQGVLTPNEARQRIGEEPVEDPALDQHYIGTQQISTQDGVASVTQALSELKAALAAATGGKYGSGQPAEDTLDTEDADLASQSKSVRRRWQIRRSDG